MYLPTTSSRDQYRACLALFQHIGQGDLRAFLHHPDGFVRAMAYWAGRYKGAF
jgi:hypothetical protein